MSCPFLLPCPLACALPHAPPHALLPCAPCCPARPARLAAPRALRALLPHAPCCPARQRAPLPSAPACPAAKRQRVPCCPRAPYALLPCAPRAPSSPCAPCCPGRQRSLLPSARTRPAAPYLRVPRCPAPARAPLPSARACPAARVPRTPCCPARLACAAAAAKLLLPLASSVPCPAQRYCALPCCAPLAHAASRTPLPCRAARDLPCRAARQLPALLALPAAALLCRCYATAAATTAFVVAVAATALATATAVITAAMATPTVLALDAEGRSLWFKSWLEDFHQYLQTGVRAFVCVAACAPTSTGAVPAEALLSVPFTLADPTFGLVYAHPSTVLSCLVITSDSSGLTEEGDPAAADTSTYRRLPRLKKPPVFPPRTSSPPLQPDSVDFGGPGVVGGGDTEGSGSGGSGSGGAGSGGADSGGARSPLVGVGGTSARGAGSGGALQSLPRQPSFVEQPSSLLPEPAPICATPPLLFPPPYLSRPLLPSHSPLPAPARYSPFPVSLTGRRVHVSCAASPATSRVTREPVVIPLPPPSSFHAVPDPVSDLARAALPTIPCCLAALVTAPASSPAAASALVAELAGFAATCRRAYLAGLVSASSCPMSVGGELALGYDVLEDRQFELKYLPYPLSI
ncbi:unnamed protein product [Closterium sp. NIES-53]